MSTRTDVGSQVLVIGADSALYGLIEEWLAAAGCSVTAGHATHDPVLRPPDLVIVDVPFPRQGGLESLRRAAREHPGTPILALSSAFFAGIESTGAVARTLGVAGALPKPLTRETLLAAVGNALPATGRTAAP